MRYPEPGAAGASGDGLGAQAASQSDTWGFGLEEESMSSMRKSHRKLRISGPFSPIEMKFFSMAVTGNNK